MHSLKKKTIVYVDGLNFFGGAFQDASSPNNVPRKFRWLDLRLLLEKTLPQDCQMAEIKYFTSVIKGDNESSSAQSTYISALTRYTPRNPKISVFLGKIQKRRLSGFPPLSVKRKNGKWKKSRILAWLLKRISGQEQHISIFGYREKQSDVTLGVHIMADVLKGKCDCIALLTGDSDFVGALQLVKEMEPSKEILLVLPVGRTKVDELLTVADRDVTVHTKDILSSRLPDKFKTGDTIGNLYQPRFGVGNLMARRFAGHGSEVGDVARRL